jgi:uncharacterized protein (DUF433 family)
VVDELRAELGTPYPLAVARPYVYDKDLVLEVQERAGLPPAIAMVVRTGQTIALACGADRFFKKVEFEPGGAEEAIRLRPAGKTSPVVIDPLVRFGRPTVEGIATERLWELVDAGDAVDEIAEAYEIEPDLVRSAVAYEEQQRTLAA